MPKVSICIPTYRQVEFLRRTLSSISRQRFDNYEVIITDDSPDDSIKNLLSEFDFDGRLKYFHNPTSLGSPANWNEAVHRANGEYIKILHHDDELAHPDALGAFVGMLETNPNADFGFCASRVEDLLVKAIREHRPTQQQLQMLSTKPEKLFLGNCIGAPSATIYRRSVLMEYDNRMKWLVDIDFYIRVLQGNKNFSYTSEVLISTPTNAGHQVTEVCKNDAEIELYEYSTLYLKNSESLSDQQDIMSFWFRLIGKYGINATKNVMFIHQDKPDVKEFLEKMLHTYSKKPFLRMIYFVYWRLPVPIFIQKGLQLFIRFIYATASGLRAVCQK